MCFSLCLQPPSSSRRALHGSLESPDLEELRAHKLARTSGDHRSRHRDARTARNALPSVQDWHDDLDEEEEPAVAKVTPEQPPVQ